MVQRLLGTLLRLIYDCDVRPRLTIFTTPSFNIIIVLAMQSILYYIFSLASTILLYTNASLHGIAFSGATQALCVRSYMPLGA